MTSFDPGVVIAVKRNRTANHTIEKVVEFQLHALCVDFLPISAAKR